MSKVLTETVEALVARSDDLEALIRWLATPYGTNPPVFATAMMDGAPLPAGQRMAQLYAEVVGVEVDSMDSLWVTDWRAFDRHTGPMDTPIDGAAVVPRSGSIDPRLVFGVLLAGAGLGIFLGLKLRRPPDVQVLYRDRPVAVPCAGCEGRAAAAAAEAEAEAQLAAGSDDSPTA